ncbi:PD-(D/E)XK nuclease domain-containing protein [Mediterraneibacter butyricigenes]|uniref:PD-(D/E)XK nuclease domain-containing protein n=1 Tax=Mediterraneibacter butyricigenes TaxID=2316025 RepID=UPI001FA9A546|nr:PD-(D/E)XK nuclease domain-containing protein [Mediterraneibacter butyricigenes]
MQREHPFFVNIISPVKSCPLQLAGRQLYFYSLRDQYRIVSNRESGRGRYDIAMYPLSENMDGFLMEFKVRNASKEKDLIMT